MDLSCYPSTMSFGKLEVTLLWDKLTVSWYSRVSFVGFHFTPKTFPTLARMSGSSSPDTMNTFGLKPPLASILDNVPSYPNFPLASFVTFPTILDTDSLDPSLFFHLNWAQTY